MTVGEFLVINDFEEVVVQSDYCNFGIFTPDGLSRFLKKCEIVSIGFHHDGKRILLRIADE